MRGVIETCYIATEKWAIFVGIGALSGLRPGAVFDLSEFMLCGSSIYLCNSAILLYGTLKGFINCLIQQIILYILVRYTQDELIMPGVAMDVTAL